MLNGGWVVVRKGALIACEKVDSPPKVTNPITLPLRSPCNAGHSRGMAL